MNKNRFFQKGRNKKGQGAVEFALILPLLLLIMFGLIETGRLIFIYSTVTNAAREAMRYGSATGVGNDGVTPRYRDCAGIVDAAVNVGFLGSVRPEDVNVGFDMGPGIDPFAGCPGNTNGWSTTPPTDAQISTGVRILVEINSPFDTIVPGLLPYDMDISSESSRTIIRSVNVSDSIGGGGNGGGNGGSGPQPTPTDTPTITPTWDVSLPTHTPTNTPTRTPTNTPTRTPTQTPTPSLTPTPTITLTPLPVVFAWAHPAAPGLGITHRNDTRFEVTAYDPNVQGCAGGPTSLSQACGVQKIVFNLMLPGTGQVIMSNVEDTNRRYCAFGGTDTCGWMGAANETLWTLRVPGTYRLTARLYLAGDNPYGSGSQEIETTFVIPETLPVVIYMRIVTPENGKVFANHIPTTFEVIAYDSNLCENDSCSGTGINRVEMQVLNPDGTAVHGSLGLVTGTSAPYCHNSGLASCFPLSNNGQWNNLPSGEYILHARACPAAGQEELCTAWMDAPFSVQKQYNVTFIDALATENPTITQRPQTLFGANVTRTAVGTMPSVRLLINGLTNPAFPQIVSSPAAQNLAAYCMQKNNNNATTCQQLPVATWNSLVNGTYLVTVQVQTSVVPVTWESIAHTIFTVQK